jgi:hypothetical protein
MGQGEGRQEQHKSSSESLRAQNRWAVADTQQDTQPAQAIGADHHGF